MQELDEKSRQYLLNSIRDINDFPKPKVVFKDITTLLNNKVAFNMLLDHLSSRYNNKNIDFIAGIESRGFIFGGALCARLGIGFIPIRKPGKLPYMTISQKYSLEYGVDEIEIHVDAFSGIDKARVLLIDDLIATGGTAKASVDLIKQAGGNCIEACFLIDLINLGGSRDLKKIVNVYSVLEV
ncbi:adenine phosphoribosyltransferase [Campylobacter sp. RM12327]|uniref:adenine phosphoribosyltransferase n=1 Tax=Campylobacter sputorum TaxID=206 RepID=UPI000B780483|nr:MULTISPECIES: adenine phosphoribosyltransferase [Campylobacter]ASM39910.1 adenine phosphoribosyltransferase [Campylobacter sputorum]MBE7357561.1 adenine phosphoribosyltransferase [Campylobacter sp. RM11302]MBF6669137.1 adenine phosphoribosyltransferase [Campylobacter sp. RM12327]MBF6674387.1 adenine phosphoribosyltransferase [Campylobacter sp. RM13538]MBF6675428.1 adenine phosphoribosyltransferase [Campylobacter sp. RM12321]